LNDYKNMTELNNFIALSSLKARDGKHRQKIAKATGAYHKQVISRKENQFIDWNEARKLAAQIKSYTVENLPDLLEQFEENFQKRGGEILWARDTKEAQDYILSIMKSAGKGKDVSLVKGKSMTTEEIHLNEFCEEKGYQAFETDLGELIVQLAGEKPYHIVTPAMHKSREDIGHLFKEKLGIPFSDDASVLTAAARVHLRQKFLAADIGISGANFLVADKGLVITSENEGNIRLCMSCPKVHIAIAGIEKVLPRFSDLEFFLALLATSGTGQQLTTYTSLISGPKQRGEKDGPEKMYLILLDNSRSKIFQNEDMQEALRCIRCGACLNSCPVYHTIGGHAYHTTYQGPIGSVITPHLLGMEKWGHLSEASSLCGACTDVCPVGINLHHLLLKNRNEIYQEHKSGIFWNSAIAGWSFIVKARSRLEMFRPIICIGNKILRKVLSPQRARKIPKLSKKSFAQMWEQDGK